MATPPTLPPELPLVQAAGFSAYADLLVLDEYAGYGAQRWQIWLVSLLGPHASVRALWARLLRGELMTLNWPQKQETRFAALAAQPPKSWRMVAARLPAAGASQLLLLPRLACHSAEEPTFLLCPRRPEEAAALHYRFLNRRVELPLHASWADYLWQRALQHGEAVPLPARGLAAYRCLPDVAALGRDLSAAVRGGRLTVEREAASGDHPEMPRDSRAPRR